MQLGHASGPIEAINELLYEWLTSSATDLRTKQDSNHLHSAFQLVNFLAKAYETRVRMERFSETGEVSNE